MEAPKKPRVKLSGIELQKLVHKLADAIWSLIEKIVIKLTDLVIKKN